MRRRSLDALIVDELGGLETTLSSVARVVWADVGSEVERTREGIEELRALVRRVRDESADDGRNAGGLSDFLSATEAFCEGQARRISPYLPASPTLTSPSNLRLVRGTQARRAVDELRARHSKVDAHTRALLRWLAVEERAWARPEESLRTILDFIVAVRHQQKLAAAAAERKERLSKWRDAAAVATAGKQANLVDGVAERFASKSGGGGGDVGAPQRQGSNERSAELLRLLMRRASIKGQAGFLSDGESESESDDADFD